MDIKIGLLVKNRITLQVRTCWWVCYYFLVLRCCSVNGVSTTTRFYWPFSVCNRHHRWRSWPNFSEWSKSLRSKSRPSAYMLILLLSSIYADCFFFTRFNIMFLFQDVINHSKNLKKTAKEAANQENANQAAGLKSLNKTNRARLEAYQHLFYLLQVNLSSIFIQA